MLIDEAVKAAIANGQLILARPAVPWADPRRMFLMCEPLSRAIEAGRVSADEKTIKRWAQLEADIAHFVEGGHITKDRLKQLDPFKYEHWELRSLEPRPSLRVFGRFVCPDVFVGTHVRERPGLGAKWSLDWEMEKLACEEYWTAVGLENPFHSDRYEAYITRDADCRIWVSK